MAYSPAVNKSQTGRQYVTTTDATVTTIKTVPVRLGSVVSISMKTAGVRTGGASGSAGDSAAYWILGTFKNVTGTAVLVGAVTVLKASEDQTAWDCTLTVSGGTVIATVLGASGNNVSWSSEIEVVNNL